PCRKPITIASGYVRATDIGSLSLDTQLDGATPRILDSKLIEARRAYYKCVKARDGITTFGGMS
ncbi:MAG TPA: hypothetical protein VJ914_34890, partial [Pseudonocardiaceae bacterium]|nr:hypothetical protein [Pseudonocardiaceae bacterium]